MSNTFVQRIEKKSGAPDPNLLQLVIHVIQYLVKFSLRRQSLHGPLADQTIPGPNALVKRGQ